MVGRAWAGYRIGAWEDANLTSVVSRKGKGKGKGKGRCWLGDSGRFGKVDDLSNLWDPNHSAAKALFSSFFRF